MLAKGNRLYIPDKTAGPGKKVQSGSTLKVRVKKSLPKLRIVVRGFDGKPLADTDCILTIEGASVTVHTKSDGLLELDMPAHAADATLEANGQQWALKRCWTSIPSTPTPACGRGCATSATSSTK